MLCPAGVTWRPGAATGPMAQRVRKKGTFSFSSSSSFLSLFLNESAEVKMRERFDDPYTEFGFVENGETI